MATPEPRSSLDDAHAQIGIPDEKILPTCTCRSWYRFATEHNMDSWGKYFSEHKIQRNKFECFAKDHECICVDELYDPECRTADANSTRTPIENMFEQMCLRRKHLDPCYQPQQCWKYISWSGSTFKDIPERDRHHLIVGTLCLAKHHHCRCEALRCILKYLKEATTIKSREKLEEDRQKLLRIYSITQCRGLGHELNLSKCHLCEFTHQTLKWKYCQECGNPNPFL